MYDSDAAEMKCFDWGDSAGFLLSILNLKHFLSFFFFFEIFFFFFAGKMLKFPKMYLISENGMHLDLADQDT